VDSWTNHVFVILVSLECMLYAVDAMHDDDDIVQLEIRSVWVSITISDRMISDH
jgi:hypothetical protein